MMEYGIVTDWDIDSMVIKVNEKIQSGWRLLGGISCTVSESDDSHLEKY